ncbi:MAG: hypothetical protein ACR2PI_17570 [Hyphomicrobiaceae bacterium]
MTDQDLKRAAAELGLEKLASEHAADLRKALINGKALSEKIPTDLHWSEEAAHTLNLAPRKGVSS